MVAGTASSYPSFKQDLSLITSKISVNVYTTKFWDVLQQLGLSQDVPPTVAIHYFSPENVFGNVYASDVHQ